MDVNLGTVPAGTLITAENIAQMMNSVVPAPPTSYRQGAVIHERNHEGKPSATHVSGKPGSVLPRELLVHLQEAKGEEREKEVLKAVEAIGKKTAIETIGGNLQFQEAQIISLMNSI